MLQYALMEPMVIKSQVLAVLATQHAQNVQQLKMDPAQDAKMDLSLKVKNVFLDARLVNI